MKEQEPESAEEWLRKGQQCLKNKLHYEALAAFKRALTINQTLVEAWCGQGRVMYYLQRYDESAASYEKALNSSCKICPVGWYFQGAALKEIGRNEEAVVCFNKALELGNPDPARVLLDNSFSLIWLEKYKEALDVCDHAIKIKPDYADAHLNRGIAFHCLGDHAAALKSYDQAIHFNENLSKIWHNRGETLTYLCRYRDAASSYAKAIELEKDQYWLAWIDLGQVTVNLNGYKAAQDIWMQGIQKLLPHPNKRNYLQGRAELYYTKGSSYSTQAKLNNNPLPYWRLAQQCYGKALEYFEQLLQSYSSDLRIQERYLLTLQKYINTRCCTGISDEKLQKLLRDGTSRLQILLNDASLSEAKKVELALKFSAFDQLTVDYFTRFRQFQRSLETAERDKNACLTWMLDCWTDKDKIASPVYKQIESNLLNANTVIIYWHYSPVALTTFILKEGESAPISIIDPDYTSEKSESSDRLRHLERWMQDWDQQYSDYRNKGKEQRDANHSWRKDMAQRLFERQEEPGNLKEILNIEAIAQHLDGINHLSLVPHRDLHRFPLHALFDSRLVVTGV